MWGDAMSYLPRDVMGFFGMGDDEVFEDDPDFEGDSALDDYDAMRESEFDDMPEGLPWYSRAAYGWRARRGWW